MTSRPSPRPADPARLDEALSHADELYDLARHLTGNVADAEDLVQDTYARAVRAWGDRAAGTSVAAWLFRILRNAFIDRYRRDRRSPMVPEEELETAVATDGGWLRSDAELEHMRGLVGEEIEVALSHLSDDARTVVLLDVQGMTETEIAHVLGCPVGTVKSRLSRARAALRRDLAEYAMGSKS